MFKKKKGLFKIFKLNLLLQKNMAIFLSIFFLLIVLIFLIIIFTQSNSNLGLTMDSWRVQEFYWNSHSNGLTYPSQEIPSVGLLWSNLLSVGGFIIISISSIYMANKLFLSEFKGKMVIWLMSGVSKKELLIIKFLTIQFINFAIVFLPIVLFIFVSCFSKHDSEDIKRMFLTILNFIFYVIVTTSIYFSFALLFIKKPILFFVVSELFFGLTLVTTLMYLVAENISNGSMLPKDQQDKTLINVIKLKYISYPYLFENLFKHHNLSIEQNNKINQFYDFCMESMKKNPSGYFIQYYKKDLNELVVWRMVVKDIIFLIIGIVPYTLIYFFAERMDYKL